jgi:hypothetical protein
MLSKGARALRHLSPSPRPATAPFSVTTVLRTAPGARWRTTRMVWGGLDESQAFATSARP